MTQKLRSTTAVMAMAARGKEDKKETVSDKGKGGKEVGKDGKLNRPAPPPPGSLLITAAGQRKGAKDTSSIVPTDANALQSNSAGSSRPLKGVGHGVGGDASQTPLTLHSAKALIKRLQKQVHECIGKEQRKDDAKQEGESKERGPKVEKVERISSIFAQDAMSIAMAWRNYTLGKLIQSAANTTSATNPNPNANSNPNPNNASSHPVSTSTSHSTQATKGKSTGDANNIHMQLHPHQLGINLNIEAVEELGRQLGCSQTLLRSAFHKAVCELKVNSINSMFN